MGNMRTPASIIAGSLVGLAISFPLPIKTPDGKVESRFEKSLRLAYTVVGVMSMLSQLISIMWATVAVNQLIETNIAPAASVWALLKRDFDLEWAAVNAHFVLGMFGFCFLIRTRAVFRLAEASWDRVLQVLPSRVYSSWFPLSIVVSLPGEETKDLVTAQPFLV
jgi:hypothetical protein